MNRTSFNNYNNSIISWYNHVFAVLLLSFRVGVLQQVQSFDNVQLAASFSRVRSNLPLHRVHWFQFRCGVYSRFFTLQFEKLLLSLTKLNVKVVLLWIKSFLIFFRVISPFRNNIVWLAIQFCRVVSWDMRGSCRQSL